MVESDRGCGSVALYLSYVSTERSTRRPGDDNLATRREGHSKVISVRSTPYYLIGFKHGLIQALTAKRIVSTTSSGIVTIGLCPVLQALVLIFPSA